MKFVRTRTLAAGVLAVALVAGCSGSPHESPLPFAPNAPTAPASQHYRHAVMSVRLTIPRERRHSHFVSPSTKSIAILQGTTKLGTFDATPNSGGCASTNGGTTCLFSFSVSPGTNQTFTVNAYDALKGGGKLLSTGSITQNVTAGKNNLMLLTLSGVVASVAIGLQNPNPAAGTAASVPLTIMAKDADGNVIVGPGAYHPSIKLTDSDASGITKLSTAGVTGPASSATLTYNGKSIVSATVGATVSGVAASKVTKAVFAPVPTVVTDFALPLAAGSTPIDPTAITSGPDGNIWIAYHSHNTTTSGFIKLPTTGPMPATPTYVEGSAPSTNLPLETIAGLVAGPDGNVWYAGEGGDIGYITPSGTVTDYQLTGGSFCAGASAWRIIRSADGGFWTTIGCTGGGTQLAHVTTSGTITPYDIPGFDYVNGLVLGKDGNVYLAGEMDSNGDPAVAQAKVSGATISSSNLLDVNVVAADTNLQGILQTPDGDLWVTYNSCAPSPLTRIHPSATFSASTMTAYNSLAACANLAYGVTLADGTMWLADGNYPIVTRVEPGPYPTPPALWDLAAPSTVPGEEWDMTIGADGDLYVSDFNESNTTSGDVLKIAY